jgi:hypothetical protein
MSKGDVCGSNTKTLVTEIPETNKQTQFHFRKKKNKKVAKKKENNGEQQHWRRKKKKDNRERF